MPQRRKLRDVFISLCLVALVAHHGAYVEPPKWWQKGWARGRAGSAAEAELLSQLAVILMPDSDIGEMFRSFPSPEGWGGHALEPDLALHGVLKEKDAALFVEYDGFWRHQMKKGIVMDRKKNAALLSYAPKGSCVVRISHTKRKSLKGNVLWVKVHTWSLRKAGSVSGALKSALIQLVTGLREVVQPSIVKRLQGKMQESWSLSASGNEFARESAAKMGRNNSQEVANFFRIEGFSAVNIKMMKVGKWFRGQNIEEFLKPKLQWLLDLGLTRAQISKLIATDPALLDCRVEQNLQPTVQWLLDLGLTKSQIAKAVATFPKILGFSIEQKLQPTVQWLFGAD